MALDAITLALLAKELDSELQGARIDKIHQPSKDEIVMHMRKRDGNIKLLISARSGSARVCVTKENFENPQVPPSFCMLMRKYFAGAKFVAANSIKGERIIMLSFTATSEMGDTVELDLAVELMGRYANIVAINNQGKVIDAMKRVDADASSVRQLLPGLTYKLPPNRDNPHLIDETKQVLDKVFAFDAPLNTAFMKNTLGIGPVIAREIAYRALGDRDVYAAYLNDEQRQSVKDAVDTVVGYYNNPQYTTVYDESGKPSEFSFMPLMQYGGLPTKKYESLNVLLDEYYAQKDRAERLRQKGKDLYRLTQTLTERTQRKQVARKEELEESRDSEKYKIYGELLTANLWQLEKGMKSIKVLNYYTNEEITIPLDVKLNGNQNAQKYYKEYKKRQTAVKMLTDLIKQGEIELEYLKSINYAVQEAQNEAELMAIRSELHGAGYIKYYKQRDKKQKPQDFIKYISSDGFLICVGRNNLQNDKLTMKTARGKDMWFHTKKAPGSHVVVISEGADIPLRTQNEAAMLAVHHSSLKDSARVEIDYTFVKNIKKTNDLKPGMVIYDTYESAVITPDMDIISSLERLK
ncbi:MAG: NFACT family protein [Oscillospiraceae bacterium]|nr:NFACT family protein [Oscillospiraceae bacterium]